MSNVISDVRFMTGDERISSTAEFDTSLASNLTLTQEELNNRFPPDAVPRKFFVAHVLLELILDKVLIRMNPGILEEYYDHFEQVPPDDVHVATEKISGNDLPNYDSFIDKFRKNRYLESYVSWNHIIYVLKRILRRVNIQNDSFTEENEFHRLMCDFEDKLSDEYHDIFRQIEETPMRFDLGSRN